MAPPFRADHVGSMLRPPELKNAFRDAHLGKIDNSTLQVIEDALKAAWNDAREFGERIVIEQYAAGRDHRVLVINGKVVACAERIPPQHSQLIFVAKTLSRNGSSMQQTRPSSLRCAATRTRSFRSITRGSSITSPTSI